MKKIVFIVALFIVALVAQSCCAVSNCPGLAQVEASHNNA
jgi:hypothetical protein